MPTLTRSQTRGGQPPHQVTSPGDGANRPRRLASSRQGNAEVGTLEGVGSPSTSGVSAYEDEPVETQVVKCNRRGCMTCPKLSLTKQIISNVTNKNFITINHTKEQMTCHSQNLVYLLTCCKCNMQYVGETTQPLHKRINLHRTAKTGCQHMIDHFKNSCSGAGFKIQVLELFEGTGYSDNNRPCPTAREQRIKREDHWMKELRTIFPYGLNERARGQNFDTPVGKSFPSIPRSCLRGPRTRDQRNNNHEVLDCKSFFLHLDLLISNHLPVAYYQIRTILNRLKKKTLKNIASEILRKGDLIKVNPFFEKYYLYIMDIIDTKLYNNKEVYKRQPPKYPCTIMFDNKAVELINLSRILRHPDTFSLLPNSLQENEENRPMVSYRLGPTIRNKIFNYKDTVNSIRVDEEVSFSTDTERCTCANSQFSDPHHGHIITGDLRVVENDRLRKLLTKGPNFREPKTINFQKALKEITQAIDICIERIGDRTDLTKQSLDPWKNKVIEGVKSKIELLKQKITPQKTNPVLQDPDVLQYLEHLHKKFVIVPIDKAANNFAFICKQFYISKLLSEVSNSSSTYSHVTHSQNDLISANKRFCKRFGLEVSEQQNTLPSMYWIPKMHKSPVGARFIVASKTCSTKPLTEVISRIFKMLYNHVENFHRKSYFYSSYRKFWVVQNSFPVIQQMDRINARGNAKRISTFDFSTLYTTIPHDLLIEVLSKIIENVFNSRNARSKIGFSSSSVYWTPKGVDKRFFTKTTLIEAVTFLISQCYFTVGNLVLKQDIGIPMGIDPAPFWANLFLYYFESKYVQSLISLGSTRAFSFHSTDRFIDDLCALNDHGHFALSYKDIYPPELELKVEHQGLHATFLDLDITVENGLFIYKLFDKRDAFPFFIVRMPHLSSNIPQNIFYSSIFSELLRIARCTLLFNDFIVRASQLIDRMKSQGGEVRLLKKQVGKAVCRYPDAFNKYGKTLDDIIKTLLL